MERIYLPSPQQYRGLTYIHKVVLLTNVQAVTSSSPWTNLTAPVPNSVA